MVTDELVDRALTIVAEGGGNYEYFFAKLTSPDWIAPLQKRGRFLHPPPAISEETYLRFPGWPEGAYLTRMAPIAPEAVFGAIDAACYESNNHYVHQILLEVAAGLPAALAAQVAEAEAKWASKQTHFLGLYTERLMPVIFKLATQGHSDAALTLLKPVLEIDSAPKRATDPEQLIDGRPFRGSADPVGRIDSWHTQRLLSAFSEALAQAAPENFLGLLSKNLDKAVRIHDNDRGNTDDFSFIWRPRIDSGRFGDLMDVLVSAVRDAALQIAHTHGHEVVVLILGKYKWSIFERLEYYTLSQVDNLPPEFVDRVVLRQSLYDNPTGNPEFNDFLSKSAERFSDDVRKKVLDIVDAGPDLDRYSTFLSAQKDKRGECEQRIVDQWRLGWLSVLTSIIGEERSQQLEALVGKYGPAHPTFSTGGFAVGHSASITLEELRKLSMQEMISYLKEWTPAPQWHPERPSRAGIGQVLQSWVSEDPALFSDNLASFECQELHPTYLRSILDALTTALKGNRQFDPHRVAATIEWVLSNTNKMGPEPYNWDEDPGWSWAHMSSARFLSDLFLHADRLDTSRHLEFWPALKLIAENPSPSGEDDKKHRKTKDFGMLALNSTRPVGLEAVMRYARWLKLSAKDVRADSTGLPEVFDLLAKHLDANVDNSVAVREMYGMQFGLLAWLDQSWLERQLPALFPGKQLRDLDRFAWNSYLRFSHPFAAILPAMRFRYKRAIDALQSSETKVGDSERFLGNHLMQYYALGAIELADELLTTFFAKASPALKAQTIGDIGWQLGQEGSGDLDSTVRGRLMNLWEHRLAQGKERTEPGAFGWWFASKKFPDDWSIRQLVKVLDAFRYIHPDFAVVERLAQLSPAYPFEAVHCLGIIFEEDREGWAIHGWAENPQIIIREALKGDERSRTEAERVVNLLVARGHRGFRELLRK